MRMGIARAAAPLHLACSARPTGAAAPPPASLGIGVGAARPRKGARWRGRPRRPPNSVSDPATTTTTRGS
uniref:Uncharacterized protein n=1 Tax=Arundo donax TaxID=35708 RepID=A0A0A8Z6P3_ARUDO